MAPSKAKESALGRTACIFSREKAGSAGNGGVEGMPPKRLPIVSMGSWSVAQTTEAPATAISMAGQAGLNLRTAKMDAMTPSATTGATGWKVGSAAHRTGISPAVRQARVRTG